MSQHVTALHHHRRALPADPMVPTTIDEDRAPMDGRQVGQSASGLVTIWRFECPTDHTVVTVDIGPDRAA
jgi:hypothetical protein